MSLLHRNGTVNVTTSPKKQVKAWRIVVFGKQESRTGWDKMGKACRTLTLCMYKFDLRIKCVYRCHTPFPNLWPHFSFPQLVQLLQPSFILLALHKNYLQAFYNADSQVYLDLLNFLTADQGISNLLNIGHSNTQLGQALFSYTVKRSINTTYTR